MMTRDDLSRIRGLIEPTVCFFESSVVGMHPVLSRRGFFEDFVHVIRACFRLICRGLSPLFWASFLNIWVDDYQDGGVERGKNRRLKKRNSSLSNVTFFQSQNYCFFCEQWMPTYLVVIGDQCVGVLCPIMSRGEYPFFSGEWGSFMTVEASFITNCCVGPHLRFYGCVGRF